VIELRAFDTADRALLRSWVASPEQLLLWAGPSFTWPLDDDQLAAYQKAWAGADRRVWTAVDATTGSPVGHASVRLVEPDTGRLGRVLIDPHRRGHGLGDALVGAVLSHAFTPMGLARVELGVFAHNTPAVRLYERHGFTTDEVFRGVERVDGVSWDALQMSLTRAAYAGTG